jgi:hypothetical protein
MGNAMGMMGTRRATAAPKGPLTCVSVERTTGFEPATLTLAKKVLEIPLQAAD